MVNLKSNSREISLVASFSLLPLFSFLSLPMLHSFPSCSVAGGEVIGILSHLGLCPRFKGMQVRIYDISRSIGSSKNEPRGKPFIQE